MQRSRITSVVFLTLASVVGIVSLAFVALRSLALRPIADDYCYGAVASLGVGGSVNHWWHEWSGDFILYTLKTVLVGLPLASGLPFGSSLPFISSGLVLGLSVAILIVSSRDGEGRSLSRKYLGAVVVAVVVSVLPLLWWSSWSLPFLAREDIQRLGSMITHWQDVNVGYVLAPSVCVLLVSLAYVAYRSQKSWALLLGAAFSFALAPLSLTFAAAFIGLLVLGETFSFLFGREWRKRELIACLSYISGAAAGVIAVIAAPGTSSRLAIQGARVDALSGLISELTNAIQLLVGIGLFPGLLVIAVAFLWLGTLSRTAGWVLDIRQGVLATSGLAGISLLVVPATLVSQVLNYPALWHWIQLATLLVITVSLGSFVLGNVAAGRLGHRAWPLLTGLSIVGSLFLVPLVLLGLQSLTNSMLERQDLWNSGSAPTLANTDIDAGSGWGFCWSKIEDRYDTVNRELFPGYATDRPPTLPLPF